MPIALRILTGLVVLQHEFQHAKDLCSCKAGCDLLNIPPRDNRGNVPGIFCDKMACLELRACKVADCAGLTGDDLHTCILRCARESLDLSKACKGRGDSVVFEGRNPDCIGSLNDGSLPPFPY